MDLLHAMSGGLISDIGVQDKTVEGNLVSVYNSRVGLLSVMSVRFDVDMQKRTGFGKGDAMELSTYFHMQRTKVLSYFRTIGGKVVQTPATILTDNEGNPIAPSGGIRSDPEGHHVEYTGEITINGSGEIDSIDQEIIPAVQADKRLSIHSVYIKTSSIEGTISLDFAGVAENNVFKFYCEDGPMDDLPKHSVSSLAESLRLTGAALSIGEIIYYSIQAVAE